MQGKVDARGLWGTFEGGLKFAAEGGLRGREAAVAAAAALRSRSLSSDGVTTQPSSPSSSGQDSTETALSTPDGVNLETPLHVLFLGSSIGNFPPGEDAAFLRAFPLRAGKGDTLLIGVDHCADSARVERAYNDRKGITSRFILNGLKVTGRLLGDEALFPPEKWEYVGRFNAEQRAFPASRSSFPRVADGHSLFGLERHEAFYRSRIAQTVRDPKTQVEFAFLEDELVMIEIAHKVSFLY
jgi:L-histidine Nalpha-methyltransferase / hercynylcysteine S-oxide synthase